MKNAILKNTKHLFKISLFGVIPFLLFSCSNKTPEEYAEDYCDCMEKHNDNMKKCQYILEDAKSVYGTDNKEARERFRTAAHDCLIKK